MPGVDIISIPEALNLLSMAVMLTCLSCVVIVSFLWVAQIVLTALKGVLK